LVVEAAEERDRDDRADRLDRAVDRGVFRKSEVDTGAVVVVGVGTEDLAKMGFAQDQDMVQAFSSDRADEPFGVTVLPGSGILQADAYGGYGKLYEAARGPASVVEASCWAHSRRKFFELGGLIGYGASIPDLNRRSATYVDKILKDAKPDDLPVLQSTKFELVINLKTAKALGLEVPPTLLTRADEVIE
jgi:ABC transporter substrate binding protein/Transposase IS66 family